MKEAQRRRNASASGVQQRSEQCCENDAAWPGEHHINPCADKSLCVKKQRQYKPKQKKDASWVKNTEA
jgi:hypothetical protein